MRYVGLMIVLAGQLARAQGVCGWCAREDTQIRHLNSNRDRLDDVRNTLDEVLDNLHQNSVSAPGAGVPGSAYLGRLAWFARVLQYGQSISAWAANVDQQFRGVFPGYGRVSGPYPAEYAKWSGVALDTATAVLKTIQEQRAKMSQEQDDYLSDVGRSDGSDSHQSVMQLGNRLSMRTLNSLQALRDLIANQTTSQTTYYATQIQSKATAEAAGDYFFHSTGLLDDTHGRRMRIE